MKSKYILHINPFAVGLKGGVEVNLHFLERQLVENGFHTEYIIGYIPEDRLNLDLHNQNIDHFFNPFRSIDSISQNTFNLMANASSIHLQNLHLLNPRKFEILSKSILNSKYLDKSYLHIHNFASDKNSHDFIKRFPSNHVIVYSDFMQKVVLEKTSIKADIHALFFPVTGHPQKGRNVILQPTRFDLIKGSGVSLIAITKLLDEGYDFQFIHAGVNIEKRPDKWEVVAKAIGKEKAKKVLYWYKQNKIKFELLNYYEIVERIDESSIILLPTTSRGVAGEPFGISAIQSIIAQKFVIASRSGNYRKLFHKNRYQYSKTVNIGDAHDLSLAISKRLSIHDTIDLKSLEWTQNFWRVYLELRKKTIKFYQDI